MLYDRLLEISLNAFPVTVELCTEIIRGQGSQCSPLHFELSGVLSVSLWLEHPEVFTEHKLFRENRMVLAVNRFCAN